MGDHHARGPSTPDRIRDGRPGLGRRSVACYAMVALASPAAAQFSLVGLPLGGAGGRAYALSDDGRVASGWNTVGNRGIGFTWTAEGGRVDWGDRPGLAYHTLNTGMSGDGRTLVGSGAARSSDPFRAFRSRDGVLRNLGVIGTWLQSKGMVGMGWTRPEHVASEARGVSAGGMVEAGIRRRFGGSDFESSVWTVSGGLQSLTSYIAGFGIAAPSGWTLREIYAVSADGRTFAGSMYNASQSVGMGTVVTAPAPTGAALVAMFGFSALRRRRM